MSLALYERVTAAPCHNGAFAACGYTTLYYVVKQSLSEERTRAVLAHWRAQLTLLPLHAKAAEAAHRLQMSDLEDAWIAATAIEGRCDIIATRNVADFVSSPIPARTPEDILTTL